MKKSMTRAVLTKLIPAASLLVLLLASAQLAQAYDERRADAAWEERTRRHSAGPTMPNPTCGLESIAICSSNDGEIKAELCFLGNNRSRFRIKTNIGKLANATRTEIYGEPPERHPGTSHPLQKFESADRQLGMEVYLLRSVQMPGRLFIDGVAIPATCQSVRYAWDEI